MDQWVLIFNLLAKIEIFFLLAVFNDSSFIRLLSMSRICLCPLKMACNGLQWPPGAYCRNLDFYTFFRQKSVREGFNPNRPCASTSRKMQLVELKRMNELFFRIEWPAMACTTHRSVADSCVYTHQCFPEGWILVETTTLFFSGSTLKCPGKK